MQKFFTFQYFPVVCFSLCIVNRKHNEKGKTIKCKEESCKSCNQKLQFSVSGYRGFFFFHECNKLFIREENLIPNIIVCYNASINDQALKTSFKKNILFSPFTFFTNFFWVLYIVCRFPVLITHWSKVKTNTIFLIPNALFAST